MICIVVNSVKKSEQGVMMNLIRLLTGNYIEFLQLLRDYDAVLNDHLETVTVFNGTSSDIQNYLIKVIHEVVLDETPRQIQEAPCITVVLVETSDIQMFSQLAIVLRYIHYGKIQERFVVFTGRSSGGLFSCVQNVVSKFNLESKIVAQMCDGLSVNKWTLEWCSS
jgi:hypothetical protein